MPVKKCKHCEIEVPLATKTCSCGHKFKKRAKESETDNAEGSHNDVEIDENSITAEDFSIFQDTQNNINNRFDETLASILSTQNDYCKDFNEIKQEIQVEIKALKDFTAKKLQDLREEFENYVNGRISKQDDKINEIQKTMISMKKRILELENSDDCSGSESNDEEDEENDGEREVPTVTTSNRFNPLTGTEPPRTTTERSPHNRNENCPNESINGKDQVQGAILILSDSMMKRIIENRITQENLVRKEYVRGGTVNMINFIDGIQDETEYKHIIIHTGTNDIQKISIDEITVNIKKAIEKCKLKWPEATITLSGITHNRRDLLKNDIIDGLNNALQTIASNDNQIKFLDNSYITRKRNGDIDYEVFYDDVHLNTENGIKKLAANLKNHLGLRKRKYERSTYSRGQNRYRNYRNYHEYQPTRDRRFTDYRQTRTEQEQFYKYNGFRQRNTGNIEEAIKTLAEWIGHH